VAANSNPGTTFCIHDGTYKISKEIRAQNNDRFIGLYNDSTRPSVTTSQALNIFHVNGASGVLIKGLKISGAVGGNYCEPTCGRGIYGGDHLTVINVWLTNNKNQGIGGSGPVVLVKNSLIENNGSRSFSSDGGPTTTSGIKLSKNSLTVLNSTIRDNYWNGVWCDNDCDVFTVKDSTITHNGKAGIANEVSSGPALFTGNTIKRNGWNDAVTTRRAGLLINESKHVKAYGNTFGGNFRYGIEVADSQGRLPNATDIAIHDNTMNGDLITGCSISGVSCSRNN
jgi:hypothetical protein